MEWRELVCYLGGGGGGLWLPRGAHPKSTHTDVKKISREKFEGPQTIASSSKYLYIQVYPILTLSRWKREICRGGCSPSRSVRHKQAKTRTPYRTDRETQMATILRTPFSPSSSKKTNRRCLSVSGDVQNWQPWRSRCVPPSQCAPCIWTHCSQPPLGTHARTQPALIGCGLPPYHANHHDDTLQQFRRHRSPIFLILTIQI